MRRDFTFIDDIVSGVVACLDNPSPDDGAVKAGGSVSPHRVYNIGNNRPEELMHIIDVLEEAVGKQAVRDFKPLQAGEIGRESGKERGGQYGLMSGFAVTLKK